MHRYAHIAYMYVTMSIEYGWMEWLSVSFSLCLVFFHFIMINNSKRTAWNLLFISFILIFDPFAYAVILFANHLIASNQGQTWPK